MCGFSGQLIASGSLSERLSERYFEQCAARLVHRGDTETVRFQGPISLASGPLYWLIHHRLAFQDVAMGRQPMTSHSGDWIIVFNGEIYNHLHLRNTLPELRDHNWQTRSDTETLIEGFCALGEKFFKHLDGEYAFVLIRSDGAELWAHRDPSGVKPLFILLDDVETELFASHQERFTCTTDLISFASEIKGLARPKKFDRDGVLRQFTGLYEPIRTPFKNTIALCGGGVFHAVRRNAVFSVQLEPRAQAVRRHSLAEGDLEHWVQNFSDAFSQSVADRLLSDEPLGVYLSGGVDSRAVASQLARNADPRFGRHSFTVGFKAQGYDESAEARAFARECGFTNHLLVLDQKALSYSYPLAVEVSENIQPYTNGAAKWWLSRLTRQHVKGVLTGDGSDELLCGYPSFRYVKWWMHCMRARGGRLQGLKDLPLGSIPRDTLYFQTFLKENADPWLSGSSAAGSGLDFVDSHSTWGLPHPLYGQIRSITSCLLGPQTADWLEAQAHSIQSWYRAGFDRAPDLEDPAAALLLWQNYFFRTHLPVQVLNWVGDRMEMANTLEGRTPFLSKKMRELVHTLPDRMLVHGFKDKFILRHALSRWVNADFAKAPKKQFGAPFIDLPGHFSESATAEALHSVGLDSVAVLNRIEEKSRRLQQVLATPLSPTPNPEAVVQRADALYENAHLGQVKQTLVSLAIVKHTLLDENRLLRDDILEKQILSNEDVQSP